MYLDKPLISVIVPIYNTELYLLQCLESIAAQSYKNINVILINDGSTDKSQIIADKFCKADPRFKLITQANSGVAAARQVGLNHAKGEFIIHTDSDDMMSKDALFHLYINIVRNNSNISVGAYIANNITDNKIITNTHDEAINKDQFILSLLTGKYHASLCNKLIKTELLKDITFEKDINYMEDKLFLLKVLKRDLSKISITNEVVYFYRAVEDSYTNKITESSVLAAIKVTDRLAEIFADRYSSDFINHLKNKTRVMVLLNSHIAINEVFPEANPFILNDKQLSLKHKIILILSLLNITQAPALYRKLHKLKTKYLNELGI